MMFLHELLRAADESQAVNVFWNDAAFGGRPKDCLRELPNRVVAGRVDRLVAVEDTILAFVEEAEEV